MLDKGIIRIKYKIAYKIFFKQLSAYMEISDIQQELEKTKKRIMKKVAHHRRKYDRS